MANPLLRLFSQIGLTLATAVGKAFGKAYKQVAADAAASQRKGVGSGGGAAGGGSIGWLARRGMPADEAYKVLNIEPKAALPSDIQQSYEKLFRINDVASGGSFYLQSKVYRAKQTLDRIHGSGGAAKESAATAQPQPQKQPQQQRAPPL